MEIFEPNTFLRHSGSILDSQLILKHWCFVLVCLHLLCLSPPIIATLGLHLGFSAKLGIWQVPTCKMEPRSGIIFCLNRPTSRPAGRPPDHLNFKAEGKAPHCVSLSSPICLSPPIMSVSTYYVCPHLSCLSPTIMSVPTYYDCPQPSFFLLTSPS